jgi:hypothetical protein
LAWVGALVFLFFYSTIPALSAQFATKYLFKFKPSFRYLFILVLASFLASTIADVLLSFATSSNSQFKQDSAFIPIVTFLLARFILFAKLIKLPDTGAIGESKAFKIVVLSTIIELLLALPIGLILMFLFNATS